MKKKLFFIFLFCLFLLNFSSFFAQKKIDESKQYIELKELEKTSEYLEYRKHKLKFNDDNSLNLILDFVKKYPSEAFGYFELAQFYEKNSNVYESINNAEKACELDSKNIWYKNYLLKLFLSNNFTDKATKVFEDIKKINPTDFNFLIKYSQFLIQSSKYSQAWDLLNSLEKNYPSNEHVIIEKIQLAMSENKFDLAESEIKKLINTNNNSVDYLNILAEFYEKTNKKDEALKIYKNILLIESNNIQALSVLNNYYLLNNDTIGFIKTSQALLNNPEVDLSSKIKFLTIGLMNLKTLDKSKKENYFIWTKKLADNNPTSAEAQALIADFNYFTNNYDLALEYYKKSLALNNSIFEVWQNTFNILLIQKKHKELLDSTENNIENFPAHSTIHYFNAIANYNLSNFEKAEKSFSKALKFSGEDNFLQIQIYSTMGDMYFKMKKDDKMSEFYNKALLLDQNNIYVLNNYAYYLSIFKQNLDEAKKMSKKTLEIDPNNPSYLDTYAWILFQLNDFSNAKLYQEQAIKNAIDRDKNTLYEHYGDILFKLGETNNAVEYWNKALDSNQNSKTLKNKINQKKYIENNE